MRRGASLPIPRMHLFRLAVLAGATVLTVSTQAATCKGTVYLTLDTGHMGPAEEMAAILKKHDVKATFFLANEKTQRGDTSLDPSWTAYWKARVDEAHGPGNANLRAAQHQHFATHAA